MAENREKCPLQFSEPKVMSLDFVRPTVPNSRIFNLLSQKTKALDNSTKSGQTTHKDCFHQLAQMFLVLSQSGRSINLMNHWSLMTGVLAVDDPVIPTRMPSVFL